MGLTVKRKDDLSASFGKFAEMETEDNQRDRFLKRDEDKKAPKKDKAKKHSLFGRKK
ncbi:hypothetical protein OXT66_08130 [Lentilactobacillus senioris]|uniref:hypothetical protein n=1 Tax=Lentilactobacillus senioris TaxID=931534 RepID=UPI00227F0075|nr:hypothetical protein [Lentilactobacillus senioris]MCY9807500.1 hypothetical protein [Lentilactobacillus senioris]